MTEERSSTRAIDSLLEDFVPLRMWSGARRWAGKIAGPIAATVGTSLATLIATSVLLRELPGVQAGHFALALALLETFSLVGNLGQTNLVTRVYSAHPPDGFDWLYDLLVAAALSLPLVGIGAWAASRVYAFPPSVTLALILIPPVIVAQDLAAFMMNAQRQYVWSTLLLRLPNALLLVPAILILLNPARADLGLTLGLYGMACMATAAFSALLLYRRFRLGRSRINFRQRLEGLSFLAASATTLVPQQGLVALAGVLLAPEAVATFAAVAILLRPFQLLYNILSMVVTPELIRSDHRPSWRMITGVLGLALTSGAATAVLAPALIHWVYQGRYDLGIPLAPWLAFGGAFLLVEVLPRSHLAGRAPMKIFRRYVVAHAVGVLALSALSLWWIRDYSIAGVALGMTGMYLLRSGISYGFWWRTPLGSRAGQGGGRSRP